MRITYFFRKPTPSFFSIEQLFENIIASSKIAVPKLVYLPVKEANVKGLLQNSLYARSNQGEVNHITGEVYYIALALNGKRTILTIHDLESLYSTNKLKNFLLQLFWLKLPVNKAKYITVISEHSKQKLLSLTNVAADKVIVIPNCVSLSETEYHPKLNIDKTEPILLQVGTKPNKNTERLVKAIKGLSCKLIILGKLSEMQLELLEEQSIKFENYVQLPYEEVKELYYKSDIVTFVSTFEGFGLPILEANALGRPVITSNVTAMPEVAGDSALLVDPFNPVAIRQAIEKLIADDVFRNNLVKAGYRNVQRFKPEKIAAQYEAVYRKVLEEAT
mgnify:CR=1 FL=1